MVDSSQSLSLVAGDGCLTLSRSSTGLPGWSQLSLTRHGVQRVLGAERRDHIIKRLLLFLEDQRSELHWVLTLAEQHVSFYGKRVGATKELSFQDVDGKMIDVLALTHTEEREWAQRLGAAQLP